MLDEKGIISKSKMTAIKTAIQAKTGQAGGMTADEMAEAIKTITDGDSNIKHYTWDQRPELVTAYLDEVSYDPADYTTSRIAEYAPATAAYKNTWPIPAVAQLAAGTLDRNGYQQTVSAGSVSLYNDTPGVSTPFTVLNSIGEVVSVGSIKPTGFLRWIKCPTSYNVRDLGGWACDGGTVRYGKLFRGAEITASDTDVLVNQCGVRHELNLRGINEAGRDYSVLGSGIGYSVFSRCASYTINDSDLWRQTLRVVFDCVAADKPVFFHCAAGADRTGTLACVLEALLGMGQSDIDKDYELTSFYSGTSTDERARRRNETEWQGLISAINAKTGSTFRDKVVHFALELGFTIDEINAFRAAMIDGTPETLTVNLETYAVTNTLSNVATSNSAQNVTQYRGYDAELAPNNGYVISSVSVTMDGVDVTERYFSGVKTVLRHSVTTTMTNCTISNVKRTVVSGEGYVAAVSPDSGYTLEGGSVTITMGGVNVSNYYSSGRIAIPNVTGNLVITVSAVSSAEEIENLVDNIGIVNNTTLSTSTGANKEQSGWATIGDSQASGSLLRIGVNDTIRIKGFNWPSAKDNKSAIVFYDSDATHRTGGYIYSDKTDYNNITAAWNNEILTLTTNAEVYIRLSASCSDTSAVVVTRNQVIT